MQVGEFQDKNIVMAQFSRLQVAIQMKESGLVPLFYNSDINVAKDVLKSCYDGGARLLEFTSRGDFAYEIFGDLIKYALKELPGMILGVGSVTDGAAASLYMQMGANFIVTPVLREDIAILCNRRKVLWLAGCGSLSEIAKAEELGCEIVKLFPGGVSTDPENLKSWFEAGVICVGMGSKLISKEIVANKKYIELKNAVSKTLNLIKNIK